jgi:hypothetical protein
MSTGVLRDVGTDDDFGSPQPVGCKGKVDLLFLISSFGTMKTEQDAAPGELPRLRRHHPGEIRRLRRPHHGRQPDRRVGRMALREELQR